jgi:anaerobic selenocysteine-containing dehydrogenase
MSETRPSICRLCTAHCAILATVENGRVTQVAGDPENPLFGGYTCPKGRALPEQHNHPDRLLHSVERTADGRFRPISSERAMDAIAAKIQGILDRHGPRAVAMYVGTNTLPYAASPGLAHGWLRAIGSPMFFTSNTIDQPGKQIASALHGRWCAGEQSFDTADTWLLVGLNPLISKSSGIPSQNPGRALAEAVKRGLALIAIDPRRTETARRARVHLQPRPGEDPALLAGLLHVVFAEGLVDRAFIAANVTGVEALAEAVRPFTPERVARRAGVPAEQLVTAARVFGRAERGCATCGTGPNFATRGNLSEYLALALNSVCGRWARAGEKLLRPNVLLPAFDARAQPYAPYRAWGYGEKLRVRGLTNAACGMPTAALADEILLEGGRQVKALICLGGNPMLAWPDQRKTQAALAKLELLVSLDVEMSATAQLAHYVIAPRLTLETPGMTQPAELLKYFGIGIGFEQPYAQYSPKLVDPPEGSDVIEEWQFFHGLAQRMGLALQLVTFFGWGRHVESPPGIVDLDMQAQLTTDDIYELITRGSRISLDEVKKHPHGRIFEEVQETVHERAADCDIRLDVGNADMLRSLAEVAADGFEAPAVDVDHPYRLVSRRANNFVNSSGRSIRKLTGDKPYNPAFLHPDDLAALKVRSGDLVRIRSRHDEIVAVVEADDALRPGVVSISHCFGGNPSEDDGERVREIGSNTSRLLRVDDAYDPITGIPRMAALPVAIERIGPTS